MTNSTSNLYSVLSGMHLSDEKINNKVNNTLTGIIGLESIKSDLPSGALFDKETGKLATAYNPVAVADIAEPAGKSLINKVQFIGDCKVTYKNDGSIVIRIGENLNSSNYNTTDGQTTGTASLTTPNGTSCWLANDDAVTLLKNTGTYTSTTAGKVHFPDNTGATFTVVTSVETYTFGPITENGNYKAKNSSNTEVADVTLTVSNFGEETKAADGATGYCGNISISIPATTIANGTSKNVSITQITCTNSEGTFNYTPTANTRWLETDTTTKPTVTSGAVTFISNSTKQESGVTYVTSAKMKVDVTGTNFKTPAYENNVGTITGTGFNTQTIVRSELTSNTAASKTFGLNNGAYTCNQVSVTMKNINGSSDAKVIDINPDVKVLQYIPSGSINEANRLQSNLSAWDSSKDLATIDNGGGLQVANGLIIYPATDYTGYNSNTGLGTVTTQPNYSTTTGKKTYIQKFTKSGAIMGGTVTLTSVASTNGLCGSTFDVYVWNGSSSNSWQKISKVGDGIGTEVSCGITTTLKFSFTQAVDYGKDLVYVKIVYQSACSAQIKNITFA